MHLYYGCRLEKWIWSQNESMVLIYSHIVKMCGNGAKIDDAIKVSSGSSGVRFFSYTMHSRDHWWPTVRCWTFSSSYTVSAIYWARFPLFYHQSNPRPSTTQPFTCMHGCMAAWLRARMLCCICPSACDAPHACRLPACLPSISLCLHASLFAWMQDCCLSIYPPAYHAVCLSMSFHHMCTHAVPGACRSVCTRGVCASSYNIDCVSDSISDETRLYCIQGPALHIDEWSRNYSRRSKSNGCISNATSNANDATGCCSKGSKASAASLATAEVTANPSQSMF